VIQILIVRLNGIPKPFSVALERGAQRRACNPAFESGGLTVRVRRYDARFNCKVSDAGQHDQRENYAAEETYDRLDVRPQKIIGSGERKKMTNDKFPRHEIAFSISVESQCWRS
jgi:hypothetical protein